MGQKKPNRRFRSHNVGTNIVNLSDYKLKRNELTLLSRGLKFVPTPTPDPLELQTDILLFERRLKLKQYFKEQPFTPNEKQPFKNSNGWTPLFTPPKHLSHLIVDVEQNIRSLSFRNTHSNITREEKKAIKSLKDNTEIIIRQADKGGCTVIWDRKDYIKEAKRQLMDKKYYQPLSKDPTMTITKEVNDFISNLHKRRILDDDLSNYLKIKNPRTPIFYLLPKIHKQNNPGRPIVSQINGPTSKISQFVDVHLKSSAQTTKSYIKDTTDFLYKLSQIGEIPENSLLVTIDITSLYTNIPHADGIKAARKALNSRRDKSIPTDVIIKMIEIILTKNAFHFNGKTFIQKLGTTMGSKMSVNYSILTIDDIETSFLETQVRLPLVWLRYIDDIFNIWTWGADALHEFLEELNEFHPTLKFTAEFSDTAVHFLDTTVIKIGSQLHTKLYSKPTDAHQYLHYNSCHPKSQKNNIPYSQFLRVRKICSRIEDYDICASKLMKYFLERKYPDDLLKREMERVRSIERHTLLEYTEKTTTKDTIPFLLTYHPKLTNIPKTLKRNHLLLSGNPTTKHFKECRIITAFRKGPNIKQLLVRSDISIQKKHGKKSIPLRQ